MNRGCLYGMSGTLAYSVCAVAALVPAAAAVLQRPHRHTARCTSAGRAAPAAMLRDWEACGRDGPVLSALPAQAHRSLCSTRWRSLQVHNGFPTWNWIFGSVNRARNAHD